MRNNLYDRTSELTLLTMVFNRITGSSDWQVSSCNGLTSDIEGKGVQIDLMSAGLSETRLNSCSPSFTRSEATMNGFIAGLGASTSLIDKVITSDNSKAPRLGTTSDQIPNQTSLSLSLATAFNNGQTSRYETTTMQLCQTQPC